jgi:hypothetical protein
VNDVSEEDHQGEPGGYSASRYGGDYSGHPGIATAICALLLIASCAGGRSHMVEQGPGGPAYLIGTIVGGALVGVIFWAVAYAITIKRASPAWKTGSLIALALLGLLTSIARIGMPAMAVREDAGAALNQMEALMASNGESGPIKPPANAGPMTKLMATFINNRMAQTGAFNNEAQTAGLEMVVSFDGLTKTSPVLDHCDRVAALATSADAARVHYPLDITALRREGAAYVARGEIDQDGLDVFIKGIDDSSGSYQEQWARTTRLATDAAGMCRILARRHWRKGADRKIVFTDAGDLAAAQPLLADINATGAEMRAVQAGARSQAQDEIAKMRRY